MASGARAVVAMVRAWGRGLGLQIEMRGEVVKRERVRGRTGLGASRAYEKCRHGII